VLKLFYTRFEKLDTLKGITWNKFIPFEKFEEKKKTIKTFLWSIPEDEEFKKEIYKFINYAKPTTVKFCGGANDKKDVGNPNLSFVENLTLRDMPNYTLGSVFEGLVKEE